MADIAYLAAILKHPSPTFDDKKKFATTFIRNAAHDEIEPIFEAIKNSVTTCVEHFAPLAFPPGFGFSTFEIEDCLLFLANPDCFSFRMKKEKGKSILYGKDHILVRQGLLNNLPQFLRVQLMKPKLDKVRIIDKCRAFHEHRGMKLVDCHDIGMSHTVFHLTLSNRKETTEVVVKEEVLPHQSFYCNLLQQLGWPTYRSLHMEDDLGSWEIAEYLGPHTLFHTLKGLPFRDQIERELAMHAALGDLLGRGDRHFENYVVRGPHLMPVDISYMFWPDNEDWTYEYVAGGMYEINHVMDMIESPTIFDAKVSDFFKVYHSTLEALSHHHKLISDAIDKFFWKELPETKAKQHYVADRIANVVAFGKSQQTLYERGLIEMKRRLVEKKKLEAKLSTSEALQAATVWEKMYYLANKDRYACFFLAAAP